VAERAQTVREARQAAEDYAQAVKQALEQGESVQAVASAAGVTIGAVYKLMARRWPKPVPLGD
jgi:transposase-like protein